MKEIQEKAIRIALQGYGDGYLSDENFIDLLKAILYQDEPNRFPNSLINTPGILTTPRDIANPTATATPGDVWVTYTHNENSNTSLNKNTKDINISDYSKYTKQSTFKD